MRVFLDANVLFSAANATSNIARLIDWLLAKGEAVTSEVAREEARRNLALKRPVWAGRFEQLMLKMETVPSAKFELPVLLDEKDIPLLCAAIHSRCDYFVTGDKRDFGHLYGNTVEGVEVISLLRLAELLASEQGGRA